MTSIGKHFLYVVHGQKTFYPRETRPNRSYGGPCRYPHATRTADCANIAQKSFDNLPRWSECGRHVQNEPKYTFESDRTPDTLCPPQNACGEYRYSVVNHATVHVVSHFSRPVDLSENVAFCQKTVDLSGWST